MGIFDSLLINHENIGKGFKVLTKGKRYIVAYNKEGRVIAYTTGIDVGKQLMDKYIKESGFDKTYFKIEEEFHKGKDEFFSVNEDCQICIVDKELMLKKDVNKLMESEELIPDKNNKKMDGLDKYTRK